MESLIGENRIDHIGVGVGVGEREIRHFQDNAKLRQTLIDNEEKALQSKALATIILDVPIEYHWDDMKFGNIHVNDLQAVFNELQFKTLSTRIFNDLNLRNTPPAPQQPDMFSALENEAPIPSAPAAMELPLFNDFSQNQHDLSSRGRSSRSWP